MVRPPYVVTPLEGIRHAAHDRLALVRDDGRTLRSAIEAARSADVAVVVVGYTHEDEGEYVEPPGKGGDRIRLTLSPDDEALIEAAATANANTIVVLMNGSAVITEAWRGRVPAILVAWYPGMEGGHAIADVLFGQVNPSGKLPCTWPVADAQLPFFDRNAASIEYGYYHGYRLLDRNGHEPAFPFGFGLSYTTFRYANLRLDRAEMSPDGTLRVCVDVTNTGPAAGDEVVQLYVGYQGSAVERPVKELKGFARLRLKPGETKTAEFALPGSRLAYYEPRKHGWVVEAIDYTVYAGPSSRTEDAVSGRFRIKP
jgi:beta-glucosidase